LRQQHSQSDFPVPHLDPRYAWHGGFSYLHERLHDITKRIEESTGTSYQEALRILAANLAILELVPYHSKSFSTKGLAWPLPSTKLIVDYVRSELKPRALDGEIAIIVTRQAKIWGLPEHQNIVIYGGPGETRRAPLNQNSRGGKAIIEMLFPEMK
jgi:hypothetical protein